MNRTEYLKRIGDRTRWWADDIDDAKWRDDPDMRQQVDDGEDFNLVASLLPNGNHLPAIDIDHDVFVLPSTNEGRHHLYINVEVEPDKYLKLLDVLAECGIVHPRYAGYAHERGGTSFLRPPWVKKEDWEPSSGDEVPPDPNDNPEEG